jgi:hypothetical protein
MHSRHVRMWVANSSASQALSQEVPARYNQATKLASHAALTSLPNPPNVGAIIPSGFDLLSSDRYRRNDGRVQFFGGLKVNNARELWPLSQRLLRGLISKGVGSAEPWQLSTSLQPRGMPVPSARGGLLTHATRSFGHAHRNQVSCLNSCRQASENLNNGSSVCSFTIMRMSSNVLAG